MPAVLDHDEVATEDRGSDGAMLLDGAPRVGIADEHERRDGDGPQHLARVGSREQRVLLGGERGRRVAFDHGGERADDRVVVTVGFVQHRQQPTLDEGGHPVVFGQTHQRATARRFARPDRMDTGVEQRQPLDPLGRLAEHLEGDAPTKRVPGERERPRDGRQRSSSQRADGRRPGRRDDEHVTTVGAERGDLRRPHGIVAEQSGHEHDVHRRRR